MHAYLFIKQGNSDFQIPISNLAKKLDAKILEYPLQKIEDVRNLNNLIRLSFDEPTLIVCTDIHNAGEEALNAFLKNLEEPQENIYFALTAPSVRKLLPTIVSRCEIVRVQQDKPVTTDYQEIEEFLAKSLGEKLNYIDKIKDRNDALELAENTVQLLHSKLHENKVKYSVVAKNIEAAVETYTRLKANGNVNLQLVNFVINLQ